MVATSLSSAGSMTQVRSASAWLAPAVSRADRRPPGFRLAARSLLVKAAHTWWCGWSISGHSQEISSGRSRPADRCPGQNGSSVWSAARKSPTLSCTWAVTGYTPNSLIPSALTWNEAVQEVLPPGGTLAGRRNGVPAAMRVLSPPWAR